MTPVSIKSKRSYIKSFPVSCAPNRGARRTARATAARGAIKGSPRSGWRSTGQLRARRRANVPARAAADPERGELERRELQPESLRELESRASGGSEAVAGSDALAHVRERAELLLG